MQWIVGLGDMSRTLLQGESENGVRDGGDWDSKPRESVVKYFSLYKVLGRMTRDKGAR